ncbi:polymeric immunoglobulin receptor-like [Mauremys reevesii]|uniref:polymeric immunoglobulin receptor-like n=1 Tax=Mauremys reevesii TaxID=260615 RepID=UPI00193FB57D|nr:polymeric immunoglobulin receptor-like [Mauremys reevesii]
MELRFLLLLLCISGFQAQEFDAVLSRVEGQRLTVECRYSSSVYSATRKTWCQLRDKKCFTLVSTSYTSHRYHNKVTAGRATIEDDTRNEIVTITMEKLQVQDSGVYWCAHYNPLGTVHPLKTIKLDVSKAQEYNAIEGQNLSVQCPYNTQDYKKEKKAWCRSTVQNECDVLVNTDYGYLTYQNSAEKGRARIHDDTQKGIVTITMEKLQVDDAGVYWCALYEPPSLYRIIEIKLAVAKATTTSEGSRAATTTRITPADSSLSSRSTFLWLAVGFLINKTLLAVMIALPVRGRNHLRGSTQAPTNCEFMGNGAAEASTGDLSEGVRS